MKFEFIRCTCIFVWDWNRTVYESIEVGINRFFDGRLDGMH